MNANTIEGTTFMLKAGSNSVAAVVSYNATAKQATLNPNATLALNTAYTATVRGEPTGGQEHPRRPDVRQQGLEMQDRVVD